mmetsp:Transcript_10376/g.19658  ORF Transcript_10376/g.19658 Transcript_10376/m.19658 type:complete len:212 (-) Transcript_10376:212-847(-)
MVFKLVLVFVFFGMVCCEQAYLAPGRQQIARQRALGLTTAQLSGEWESVRKALLWSCGLAATARNDYCFNDMHHVDCCTIKKFEEGTAEHEQTNVFSSAMHGKPKPDGSLPDEDDGYSDCTSAMQSQTRATGCYVANQARPAFKLIWCEVRDFTEFLLVDDDANVLARGAPQPDTLPHIDVRTNNYRMYDSSRYQAQCQHVCQKSGEWCPL